MRRQYGHSCGSLMPPLVGGGIRSCVGDDDDIDDVDDDDDEAGAIVFCEPALIFFWEKNTTRKTKQYKFCSVFFRFKTDNFFFVIFERKFKECCVWFIGKN